MLLIKKKDGAWRKVIDYHNLNKVTIKEPYPLPCLKEAFNTLVEAKYMTTFIFTSGYWQIPIAEENKGKTAFTNQTKEDRHETRKEDDEKKPLAKKRKKNLENGEIHIGKDIYSQKNRKRKREWDENKQYEIENIKEEKRIFKVKYKVGTTDIIDGLMVEN